MELNPRLSLVIIKGKDHTDEVLRIVQDDTRTVVTFRNGKSYRYGKRNVEFFSSPKRIVVNNGSLSIAGDLLSDVTEVLQFGNWIKVFHGNGFSRCCPASEFSVRRTSSSQNGSKDILAYLREIAEAISLRTSEGESLLAMKYRHLNIVSRHSVLFYFLNGSFPDPEKKTSGNLISNLIFPFGCNMSQKMAVERAVQSQISLIQGPPGTGKTQTILNLIANLLSQNKRVAVVSNNNSATSNVLEKLEKYGLDFLCAFLGSTQNKKAFIERQTDEKIEMPSLQARQVDSVRRDILRLNRELEKAFLEKNELAAVIQQIDTLRLELTHFEAFRKEVENNGSSDKEQNPLLKVSSRRLIRYWLACEWKAKRRAGFLDKIHILFQFGIAGIFLSKLSIESRIPLLQRAYYLNKLAELDNKRRNLEASLSGFKFDECLERLTELSMQIMKHQLGTQYNGRKRKVFSLDDLWKRPEDFLNEYPVILSTTFSVITSIKNGHLFDCVIVDEASQVDLLNGALAMGCAKKIVIVGDPMQLPNVLNEQDKKLAYKIASKYELPKHARFDEHNLLSAIRTAFSRVPETLLKEHYRCHPKIIQFCNQKFYGGELLIMTKDQGEPDVLKAYMTVEGHHARGTINQRQIDEVVQNVLPEFHSVDPGDIGIVSPYRAQVARMRAAIHPRKIEVDTVHKYQGREKRIIVITTVSNEENDFVDDPNLLNVAISRAKDKLWIVTSKEMADGKSNIADFIRYIRYNNCEVLSGRVRSVFDLLYSEYTAERLKKLRKRKRVSKYDSENLIHGEIEAVLQESEFMGYGVALQFPLSMLVKDTGHLTAEESAYVYHPWTKTDFLIYRKVDKNPVLVIEVDGYSFHREGTRQAERDVLKDSVLKKCEIPILRLSTIGSNERNRITQKLHDAIR